MTSGAGSPANYGARPSVPAEGDCVRSINLPAEERFRRPAEAGSNCRATRRRRAVRNRCELTGRPRGYYRKLQISRIALQRLGVSRAWSRAWSSRAGREKASYDDDRSSWGYADPDPQCTDAAANPWCPRRLPSCAAAFSTCCRMRAISAAMRKVDYDDGKSEYEIELKYFDGQPVIKNLKRVSTPGRRVYASVRRSADDRKRAGRGDPVDAQGRDVGFQGAETRTSAARFCAAYFRLYR